MNRYRLLLMPLVVTVSASHGLSLDMTRATIEPHGHTVAARLLIEEVERRSNAAEWTVSPSSHGGGTTIDLSIGPAGKPEGFRIQVSAGKIAISGNDERGLLFGAGRLLRELRIENERVTATDTLAVETAPHYPIRGHQLGYRPKPNSYDGWTVSMWDQYIRDLLIFGNNTIELLPPSTDDNAVSPHFPLPQMKMMVEMSRICAGYGLNVSVWYPAMAKSYDTDGAIETSVREWTDVLRRLPRLDALFVPGGDPGHTRPRTLFRLLEKQAASLRRYHPRAQVWVSPQSFSAEWMEEFFALLQQEPAWLTGVVYGPEVRMSIGELRQRIPKRYLIRDYPDITHSTHSQYVVPDWDVAFALTQGREPINPRPRAMAQIFRATASSTSGSVTYSEGCNDDVNKIIWSALLWDPDASIDELLRQYSRFFIGAAVEEPFAAGVASLERNWTGPLAENQGVEATLDRFRTLEREGNPKLLLNWRFQMALYRAYYDAVVRRKLLHSQAVERSALEVLSRASDANPSNAIDQAEQLLDDGERSQPANDLRTRVFALAEALYQSIRMQLSVNLYKAEARERGATLDNVDVPLNDASWLKAQFAAIRKLENDEARLAAIRHISHWDNPGPGGFYDDLGDPKRSPHLVRPPDASSDPGHLETPFSGFARRPWLLPQPWKLSTLTDAESMFDAPVEMRYTGLNPSAEYRLRVIYGGEKSRDRILRLAANERFEIHGFRQIVQLTEPVEFAVPREATKTGELALRWTRQPGLGGAGRGCQIAEVWLMVAGASSTSVEDHTYKPSQPKSGRTPDHVDR